MKPELTDSRRLTGANLFWEHPSAIIDAESDGPVDELIKAWELAAGQLLDSVGHSGEQTCYRAWQGGVSLLISAPIDVLYSMCELNEAAWDMAMHACGWGDSPDLSELVPRLNRLFDEERNPPLLALQQTAQEHGVPFLWDDDEVSIGYGKTTLAWPPGNLPRPDEIDWGAIDSIPVAMVTGTNGKSTTCLLYTSPSPRDKD